MSDYNSEAEGAALPPEPRSESTRSASTEREIQENKARAAVDYHLREVRVADTAVENLKAKIERLKEHVASAEEALKTAEEDRAAAEKRVSEAEAHVASEYGEVN